MNIQKVKTKNSTFYYLNKSYRDVDTGRPRSKIVEKLGSREDLEKKLGKDCDIDKWLKDYAKKRTEEESNKETKQFNIKKQVQLTRENFTKKNIGYLFLEKIAYELGLDKICKKIEKEEKTNINLFEILSSIIYRGLLGDDMSFDLEEYTAKLFKNISFKKSDITKAVKIIVKHNVDIQKNLYKNIDKLLNNDKKEIFYICSNYALALSDLEYEKYSKKTYDNTTLVKVFYDKNFIPCGLLIDCDYFDYKDTNDEVLQHLKYRFGDSSLYVLPDSVKTSVDKKVFNKFKDNKTVSLRIARELSKEDIAWALDFDGWYELDDSKAINLIDQKNQVYRGETPKDETNRLFGTVFRKSKEVYEIDDETGKEVKKNMLFTYNAETDKLLNDSKMDQLLLFQQSVQERVDKKDARLFSDKKHQKFLKEDTTDVENYNYYFNDSLLAEENSYFGFNLVCEDIDIETLYLTMRMTYYNFNFADLMFRNILQSHIIDDKLTYKESLISNFLIDYIEISIFKVLEYYLNQKEYKFWDKDIILQLKNMDVVKVSDNLWVPVYEPSSLTEALHEKFGFDTDFNVITDEELRKIISL